MTYMTKEQLRQHLLSAPPGTTPGGIIKALRANGVQMEGDPSATQPSNQPSFSNPFPAKDPLPTDPGFSGYLGRVKQRVEKATNNIFGQGGALDDYQSGRQGFLDTTLQTAGNLFSAAVSPATEASSTVVGGTLRATGLDKPLAAGVQNLMQSPIGQKATNLYNEAAQRAPQEMKTFKAVGKAVVDAADVYGTGQVVKAGLNVAKKGVAATKDAAQAAFPTKDFDEIVAQGINKGVKPSFRGPMRTSAIANQEYMGKASEAVRSILDRQGSLQYLDDAGEVISQGHAPKNLSEFAQAIDQTKRQIFDEYSSLSTQATGKGMSVEFDDVIEKLIDYADDPVKQLADKRKTAYALELADELMKRRSLDPKQTEQLIAELNKGLAPAYADKSAKGIAEVDMSVANLLREKLDDVVTKATGTEYQPLKNAYGSLKSIEKDVGHRALILARQNAKTLPDFTDIFTGGDLVAGFVSANPALFLRGATGFGIKQLYKKFNSPDATIMRMFNKAGKLYKKAAESIDDIPLSQIDSGGKEAAYATGKSLSDYEADKLK